MILYLQMVRVIIFKKSSKQWKAGFELMPIISDKNVLISATFFYIFFFSKKLIKYQRNIL